MSEDHCALLRSIFAEELADATVFASGANPALNGFYTRTLQLRRRPAATPLRQIAPEPAAPRKSSNIPKVAAA